MSSLRQQSQILTGVIRQLANNNLHTLPVSISSWNSETSIGHLDEGIGCVHDPRRLAMNVSESGISEKGA